MANTDALEAIKDIKEAIEEYGNTISIRTETQDQSIYDPRNPNAGLIYQDVNTKGIVKTEATQRVVDAFENIAKIEGSVTSFELAIIFSGEETVSKKNKLIYRGDDYKIVFVSEKTIQDTIISYEVLAKH